MDTQQSKRGLFIGAFIFALLVFGVGVGMWLFSRNTDNRSQASAEPVAAVRIISQKETTGALSHSVLVDISQMKTGTAVSEFSTRIFIAKKDFTPPDQVTAMPRPSYAPVTPTMYPQKVTSVPSPYAQTVTVAPVSETSERSVLGATTDQLAALPPGTTVTMSPSRSITKEPIPSGPVQETFLARSSDGNVSVKGSGQFVKLQNLRVTFTDTEKGYILAISAQASVKDVEMQKAFTQPQALFTIMATETKAAILTPVVQTASVKGYLPGLRTIVELTKSEERKPTVTVAPTEMPPVVVSTCRTTKDCPKGYVCTQPKTPPCPQGRVCPAVMASWQCTLVRVTPTIVRYPSKVIPSRPPVRVTGRQEIFIKAVQ